MPSLQQERTTISVCQILSGVLYLVKGADVASDQNAQFMEIGSYQGRQRKQLLAIRGDRRLLQQRVPAAGNHDRIDDKLCSLSRQFASYHFDDRRRIEHPGLGGGNGKR